MWLMPTSVKRLGQFGWAGAPSAGPSEAQGARAAAAAGGWKKRCGDISSAALA
jgi:hypothetical protein